VSRPLFIPRRPCVFSICMVAKAVFESSDVERFAWVLMEV
jgi:hypothetical protein